MNDNYQANNQFSQNTGRNNQYQQNEGYYSDNNGYPNGQPVNQYDYAPTPSIEAQSQGQPIPPAPQNPYGYNNGVNPQAYMQTQMYPPNEEPQSGLAVASLIIGIISLLASCCYGFGAIIGVVSIVLSVLSRGDTNGKFTSVALGGLVCGLISVVWGIFVFFALVILGASIAGLF